VWDDFWSKEPNVGLYALRVGLFERNRAAKGMETLEVGAGTGIDSVNLALKGANVTCLDYSDNALNASKKVFSKFGAKGNFVKADAVNLPFADDSFDLVFNAGVVEHFKKPDAIIKEMRRASKKYVMVWVPQKFHPYTLKKKARLLAGTWKMGWETEYSILGLKRLLERNGLRVVDYSGSAPSWASAAVKKHIGSFIGLEIGVLAEKSNR
jgi:ubiquinone/menaquinone biosynthesis C-methylase UbiE